LGNFVGWTLEDIGDGEG
jgi:hypothetical protein